MTDALIKDTMKKLNKIKHMTELINLARHDISLNNKIRKKIEIELTTKTLDYTKITFDKTNQTDQLIRKRIIKLFNDKLPI